VTLYSWSLGKASGDCKRHAILTCRNRKEDNPGNHKLLHHTSVPEKIVGEILLEAFSRNTKNKKVFWSNQL